jgi:hypothetical protein
MEHWWNDNYWQEKTARKTELYNKKLCTSFTMSHKITLLVTVQCCKHWSINAQNNSHLDTYDNTGYRKGLCEWSCKNRYIQFGHQLLSKITPKRVASVLRPTQLLHLYIYIYSISIALLTESSMMNYYKYHQRPRCSNVDQCIICAYV